MPVLKIAQKGFENFSGYMGDVEFVDGVSVEAVSMAECRRLGCIMSVETLDGQNPSTTQLWEDMRYQPLTQPRAKAEEPEATPEVSGEKTMRYSREDLEQIADERGISGLREVAAEFGVKGRSINELIEELVGLNS